MASNASDSKILEYKDTISQLNKMIKAQSELIQSLREDHATDCEMIKTLQEQIDYLKKSCLVHQVRNVLTWMDS